MAGRQMNLQLIIGADGRAVAPVTAEVRREVTSVGDAGRAAAGGVSLLTTANDEAAAAARRAMEAIRGQAAAERDLRASIDRATGVRPVLNDNQYKQRQADIAAYGAELDRLRARFVPAAAAEQSLLTVQAEINRAFKVGAIDAMEHAAALETNRLAHDHVAAAAARQTEEYQRLAQAGREAQAADQAQAQFNALLGVGGTGSGSARASADVFAAAGMFDQISAGAEGAARSTALASHEMTNLTFQMNDIVMMLASGQSPFILMMQQGSQITQIMGQRGLGEILPALGGAITNLISPTTMFLAGITAAGYAGYAAFRLFQPAAVDAEAALERQAKLLEDLTVRYGRVGEAAKRAAVDGTDLFRLRSAISEQELGLLARSEARSFLGSVTAGATYDPRTDTIRHELPSEFREFAAAIEALRKSTAAGVPDVEEFRRLVSERWGLDANNDELTRQAKTLLENTDALIEYARALKQVAAASREAMAGQRGVLIGGGSEDARNEYLEEQRRMMRDAQLSFDADISAIGARSPSELAAVARRREELRTVTGEGDEARQLRIDLEGRRALAEAEHALGEASRERARSLTETLAAARLDLDLVGKSAVEVERLRMEHQLLSELRREAAQNGVEASQQEVDAIRAVAAATANLRAIAGAREYIRTKAEDLEMLRMETALVGASSSMRAQLLARLESEREIRERGIDAMGSEAQRIRAVNAALAEQQHELERLQDGWNAVQQAGEGMIDTVFEKLVDGDWEGALKAIGDDMLKLSMQLGVTNPLKNAALGTNYGTFGDLGGWGGIAGRLFGGGDSAAEKALSGVFGGQAVASMSVSAGTVILSGGDGSLLGNVTRVLTGANDNGSGTAVERLGDAARSAAGDLQTFGGGLGEFGRNLMNAFPSAPSGGGGGILSMLGNLFGLGSSGNSNLSPAAWQVVSSGRMTGLFDQGGPTGGTDPTRIAGFVHEQEYVFDAASTRRIGVGRLDAIRRGALNGYREGGYVVADGIAGSRATAAGGAPSINFTVTDRAGVTIERAGEPRQNADGSLTIPLLINQLEERMVASMQGGRLGAAAQKTYGLRRQTR